MRLNDEQGARCASDAEDGEGRLEDISSPETRLLSHRAFFKAIGVAVGAGLAGRLVQPPATAQASTQALAQASNLADYTVSGNLLVPSGNAVIGSSNTPTYALDVTGETILRGGTGIGAVPATNVALSLGLADFSYALWSEAAVPSYLIGSLGLGTTGNVYMLDVRGGGIAIDNGDWGGYNGIRFRNTTDSTYPSGGGMYQANNNALYIQAGSGNSITFRDGSGNGVAAFTSGNLLYIFTPGGIRAWGGDSTAALQIQTNDGAPYVNFDSTNQRVGIGTVSPARNLHIAGLDAAIAIQDVSVGGQLYVLTNNAAGDGTLGLYDQTAGSFRWLVTGVGNIGIGTTSPNFPLDVGPINQGQSATAGAAGLIRNNASADTTPYTQARLIVYGGPFDVSNWGYFGYGADAVMRVVYGNTNSAAAALSLGTSSAMDGSGTYTNRVHIDYLGNVGIGTTTPSGILDARGGLALISASGTPYTGAELTALGVTGTAEVGANIGQLRIADSSTTSKALLLGIDASANVGFISTYDSGVGYYNLAVAPNGGMVGIGTSSPSALLTLAASGQFKVGSTLIADTNGSYYAP